MSRTPHPTTQTRTLGPLVGFAAFGAFWGAWDASIPEIKTRTGASDPELGFALLSIGLAAVLSMIVVVRLADRWGPRFVPAALAAFGVAASAPAFSRLSVAVEKDEDRMYKM